MGSIKRPKVTAPFGTRVRVPFPFHYVEAFVIQHRGFIGEMEMVRVRALHEDSYFGDCDYPVKELEIVPRPHTAPIPLVKAGTRVRVNFPGASVEATVVEDRGLILDGDVQMVRVRAVEETYYLNEFEIPSCFIEVLPREKPRKSRVRKTLRPTIHG